MTKYLATAIACLAVAGASAQDGGDNLLYDLRMAQQSAAALEKQAKEADQVAEAMNSPSATTEPAPAPEPAPASPAPEPEQAAAPTTPEPTPGPEPAPDRKSVV